MKFFPGRTSVLTTLLAMSMAGNLTGMLAGQVLAGDVEPRVGKALHRDADAIGDRLIAEWVERRVQERQSTAAERRFDDIGWATDIREAERLAKKHERPVFLFTYNGRMATGRC
jgi:hypothetical protein